MLLYFRAFSVVLPNRLARMNYNRCGAVQLTERIEAIRKHKVWIIVVFIKHADTNGFRGGQGPWSSPISDFYLEVVVRLKT